MDRNKKTYKQQTGLVLMGVIHRRTFVRFYSEVVIHRVWITSVGLRESELGLAILRAGSALPSEPPALRVLGLPTSLVDEVPIL